MPISQTEGYFEKPFFIRTYAFPVGFKMKTLRKSIFQKPTQVLQWKLLKEAAIHFYCLFDESHFSDICTVMELKDLNSFCKHMKNIRSSQPYISTNFFSKAQVLSCNIVKLNVSNRC